MEPKLTRFYWLDIMRGVAALSVVLWHWQQFFFNGSWSDVLNQKIDHTNYPFNRIFWPLYEQGWRAVELFFTLSGFIFFWLYSERISKNGVTFWKYLILRVSRLYPLHILTLFTVIIGQLWYHTVKGKFFVYDSYTISGFITNLTLTGCWFSSNFSFNGPAWSVSVEMFLYIIFFAACRFRLYRWWHAIVFILIGWLLKQTTLISLGTGVLSFFTGGIAFYLYKKICNNLQRRYQLLSTLSLPIVIACAAIGRYVFKQALPSYFFELLVFPLIIVIVATLETILGSALGKRFSVIGDISYSSYLWHFPLQLLFATCISLLGWSRAVFYSPWSLLSFYALLIPISLISYRYYEIPLQFILRKRLLDNPISESKRMRT